MQFVYPLFLGALALLAIPILIHLFYFRRYKKVLFSNVRFIRELKEESSVRSRLKNLLILLCRLLAIALLVLAFAQPFLKKDGEVLQGRKSISLFIDNSYSMASLSQDAPLLEEAKIRAADIIKAYEPDDEFQIITHDLHAGQQRLIQKEQALAVVETIELTAEVHPLSEIFERQKQLLQSTDTDNRIIYYLSDFQRNIADLDLRDTLYDYNLIQLQAVIEKNVSIDSAWFEAPVQLLNKPNRLLVKLRNWSDDNAENLQLSIRRDGAIKPLSSVDIPANSARIDTVMLNVLQPGIQRAELRLTDFPITFDDNYFITFEVKGFINTETISDGRANPYLQAALGGGGLFTHRETNSQAIDYSTFDNNELLVLADLRSLSTGLAGALGSFLEQGGNLLLFPARQADLTSYNQFLQTIGASTLVTWDTIPKVVSQVNQSSFVFDDVFEQSRGNLRLPATQGNYTVQGRGRGFTSLLTYRNGRSYLSKFKVGLGSLFLCAAPLDENINSLVLQAEVFVPMLYKMALSTDNKQALAYTIGADNIIEIENRTSEVDAVYRLAGAETFIPGQQSFGKKVILNLYDQITQAGFYDLYLQENETLATYGFNANRLESDPSCLGPDELESAYGTEASIINRTQLADVGAFISARDQGIPLWRYCLVFALLFLALEALIIRFWRTQSTT